MGYAKYYFSSRVLNSIWDEIWRETHLSTPTEYSKWGRVLKIVCVEVKKKTAAGAMTKATLLEQVPVYCCDT